MYTDVENSIKTAAGSTDIANGGAETLMLPAASTQSNMMWQASTLNGVFEKR